MNMLNGIAYVCKCVVTAYQLHGISNARGNVQVIKLKRVDE